MLGIQYQLLFNKVLCQLLCFHVKKTTFNFPGSLIVPLKIQYNAEIITGNFISQSHWCCPASVVLSTPDMWAILSVSI